MSELDNVKVGDEVVLWDPYGRTEVCKVQPITKASVTARDIKFRRDGRIWGDRPPMFRVRLFADADRIKVAKQNAMKSAGERLLNRAYPLTAQGIADAEQSLAKAKAIYAKLNGGTE